MLLIDINLLVNEEYVISIMSESINIRTQQSIKKRIF